MGRTCHDPKGLPLLGSSSLPSHKSTEKRPLTASHLPHWGLPPTFQQSPEMQQACSRVQRPEFLLSLVRRIDTHTKNTHTQNIHTKHTQS